MNRRVALGLGAITALLPRFAFAQSGSVAMRADGYLPGDTTDFVRLWPGTPPDGEGVKLTLKFTDTVEADGFHVRAVSQIQTPGFFVYRPTKPNGLGLLIIPGGGYAAQGMDRGGREIAQHFAALGITGLSATTRPLMASIRPGWPRSASAPAAICLRCWPCAMPRRVTCRSMPPIR